MDYKYIEQLLDRYFEGETTLQEEQILKTFYAQKSDDMPENLGRYTALFSELNQCPTLDGDFEERMLRMTEGQQEEKPVQVKARVISLAERLRPLFGAAAVVAILLTLGIAINQSFRHDDTWVDAEEYAQQGVEVATGEPAVAYEQTVDSLGILKENMVPPLRQDSLL